jgi:hypothetical protein
MPMRLIRLLIPAVFLTLATPAFAQDAPYHSPMRPTCEDELKKDADWQKILRDRLRDDVHQEDADAMMRNKAHVQYAYVAILVLMVGFLGFLYNKQTRLRTEITRLEHELDEAKKK